MTEYFKIIEAKDGNLIPVCRNTDTNTEISIQSKYNPVREAESFVSQINIPASFFVVLGIGAGFHILKLLQKFPESKILAVELSDNAINFLSGLPSFNEISNNKSIQITSISNLETMLLSLYKPAIHGNLSLISLRQWETVFQNEAEKAKKIINNSIKLLSADFSVQSHFGKIWQKNILSNLSIAEKTKNWEEISKKIQNDVKLKKTAAIIAAGPSLNENISELKQNRHKYFIIATDTAFSSLLKQNIKSDAVISIDGQQVSHEHYLEILPENTLYIFDLCASPSSVRKALKFSKNVLFIQTGHPLSQYASYFEGNQNFLNLEAGSGTVTIAAASFAQKAGFSNKDIKFFGADFSYTDGMPYCRGTYLEKKYYSESTKLKTPETLYTSLMFRTPVIKLSDNKITTEILEAYRNSLKKFMENTQSKTKIKNGKFNLNRFKQSYIKDLKSAFKSENEINESAPVVNTLLPLCAKLGKNTCFLAYLKTLIYTERI